MAAEAVGDPVAPAGRWPGAVVGLRTAASALRSGVLWGYVFGIYVATQAYSYAASYKTAAARDRLAALFGSNAGVSALVGPARGIDTVAGFTEWKCLAVVAVVGAVWGLLTGTRLLRGEEDAGRWELLLAGATTRRGAGLQALAGLGAGLGALWAVTALVTVVVGRSHRVGFAAGASLYFAVAMVAGAAMFLAVGALTSQLAANRRQAAAYASAVLGVSYALRMVADSGTGLDWLRWVSPLGWVEELQPLVRPQPVALVPIIAFVVVVSAAAAHLAGRRDLGASTIPDRAPGHPRTRLLSGPVGLTARLVRPTVIGWEVGIVALAVLLGLIAKSGGKAIAASTSLSKDLAKLGATGAGARAYLGLAFLIAGVMVALEAAGQVSAMRAEEAEGRLDLLLVRPVSRRRWFIGRLGVAGAVVLAGAVAAGIAAWAGAATQHTGIGAGTMAGAGLNIAAPSLCLLGIGTCAFGVRPRATVAVTYGVLAWSFLVELVGGIVNLSHWVLDLSVFHQISAAPAVPPDWTSAGLLVAVGAGAAVVGAVAFARRDLVAE